MWTYSPQKRQARSAFALMYRLLLRSCKLMVSLSYHPCLPFCWSHCKQQGPFAPRPLRRFAATAGPPPPSRLPPFSWVRQLYGFLASAIFHNGTRRASPVARHGLITCCPYHPAGVSCRLGQPAPCHAAFAPKERARPPDLSFVSRHLWVHFRYGPVTCSPSFKMALSAGFIGFVILR